jgi:DNA-binding MarR family transcriptional regulator
MNEREIFSAVEMIHFSYNAFLTDQLKKLGLTGLSSSHCLVLETLIQSGGKMNMSEISANINRSKSTCTQLVTKLEGLGLVNRVMSHLDKRCAHVTLTQKANQLCANFKGVQGIIETIIKKALNEKEQVILVSMLDKIDYQLKQYVG